MSAAGKNSLCGKALFIALSIGTVLLGSVAAFKNEKGEVMQEDYLTQTADRYVNRAAKLLKLCLPAFVKDLPDKPVPRYKRLKELMESANANAPDPMVFRLPTDLFKAFMLGMDNKSKSEFATKEEYEALAKDEMKLIDHLEIGMNMLPLFRPAEGSDSDESGSLAAEVKNAFANIVKPLYPKQRDNKLTKDALAEEPWVVIRHPPGKCRPIKKLEYAKISGPLGGEDKGKHGAAYLVKKGKVQGVMKVVRKNDDPLEFPMHKALTEPDFYKENKINDPFVPDIYEKKATSKNDKFDFYVMEELSPSVKSLADTNGKDRLTAAELKMVFARAYKILRTLHQALYTHGDPHYGNFAFRRDKLSVLKVFDFGSTRKLEKDKTYHRVLTDLLMWFLLTREIVTGRAKTDVEFVNEAEPYLTEIDELVQASMIIMPGDAQEVIALDTISVGGWNRFAGSENIKAINKLVKTWLNINDNTLNDLTPLTHWKAGKKRRRRGGEVLTEAAKKLIASVAAAPKIKPRSLLPPHKARPVIKNADIYGLD